MDSAYFMRLLLLRDQIDDFSRVSLFGSLPNSHVIRAVGGPKFYDPAGLGRNRDQQPCTSPVYLYKDLAVIIAIDPHET